MRRMISQKQAEGLKKLNENIIVSKDGTIIEIGGNVALESIEQLGTTYEQAETSFISVGSVAESKIIATNCEGFTELVSGWSSSVIPPIQGYGNEPKTITYVNFAGSAYYIYNDGTTRKYINYGGVGYTTNILKVTSCTIADGTPEEYYKEGQKETKFKPFFTEEQYQALLDLIA